jgi:hypothetical protein
MSKLILLVLAITLGASGYGLWQGNVQQTRAETRRLAEQWRTATNDLAAGQAALAALQTETQARQERLRQARRHGNISPEMMAILNGSAKREQEQEQREGWADLRQALNLGWDASPDYVLVSKPAINDLWFNKLNFDGTLSHDSVELLNLTQEEQAALKDLLARLRAGPWLKAQDTTGGDESVVARLTLDPPDPEFLAAQSNAFTAGIAAAIGPERASFFLKDAWREFSHDLAPSEPMVMTLRQVQSPDGQPDLICEESNGDRITSSMPVRYAHYPAFPVLKLFPGGWQAMAQAMNFELPPNFKQVN